MKAKQSDWSDLKVPNENEMVSVDYRRSFSEEEYDRMSHGHIREEMSDHWFA